MGKKPGNKHPEWKIELTEHIPNTWSSEFLFSYPSEVQDGLDRLAESLTHPQTEKGLTQIEFLLRAFEDEARKVLKDADLDTEISHLMYEDDYLMGYVESSAKEVLIASWNVRDFIERGESELTAIGMLRLVTSLMRMGHWNTIVTGLERKKGQKKAGKKSSVKIGIARAVHKFLTENENYSAMQIWNKLKKYDSEDNALSVKDFEVYLDNDRLYQLNDLTGVLSSSITFNSFRKYFKDVKNYLK